MEGGREREDGPSRTRCPWPGGGLRPGSARRPPFGGRAWERGQGRGWRRGGREPAGLGWAGRGLREGWATAARGRERGLAGAGKERRRRREAGRVGRLAGLAGPGPFAVGRARGGRGRGRWAAATGRGTTTSWTDERRARRPNQPSQRTTSNSPPSRSISLQSENLMTPGQRTTRPRPLPLRVVRALSPLALSADRFPLARSLGVEAQPGGLLRRATSWQTDTLRTRGPGPRPTGSRRRARGVVEGKGRVVMRCGSV